MEDRWGVNIEITSFYCPFCGEREVEVEVGEGDYYDGPTHKCKICKKEFRGP